MSYSVLPGSVLSSEAEKTEKIIRNKWQCQEKKKEGIEEQRE